MNKKQNTPSERLTIDYISYSLGNNGKGKLLWLSCYPLKTFLFPFDSDYCGWMILWKHTFC